MTEQIAMHSADGFTEDWTEFVHRLPERLRPIAMQALRYYQKPGNSTGGSLHTVLEDGNWQREHVAWCREHAAEHGDADGVALADALLELSDDDLRAVAGC